MKAEFALVALLLAAHASVAHAASLPVMIDKLNEGAKTCGLSQPQLESVVLRTLENNPLQPDPKADGWLHVRVEVNRTRRNLCAAHISVEMKASAKPAPSAGVAKLKQQHAHVPDVVLCSEGGDYSALRATFSTEIEAAAEQYIRECLGSLKY